jgi:allantoate deiminase
MLCAIDVVQHEANATSCTKSLSDQLEAAAQIAMKELPPFQRNIALLEERQGTLTVPTLVSGAGHDAMAMSHLTQVSLILFDISKSC